MGFYWTPTSLVPLMPQVVPGVALITPSSNPISASRLEDLIQMTEGAVAAAAAEGGYAFPVSTTASVAWGYIRSVVRDGVLAQALETISPNSKTSKQYRDAYEAAVKLIRQGDMTLLGSAQVSAAEGGRQSVAGEGIESPYISATYLY